MDTLGCSAVVIGLVFLFGINLFKSAARQSHGHSVRRIVNQENLNPTRQRNAIIVMLGLSPRGGILRQALTSVLQQDRGPEQWDCGWWTIVRPRVTWPPW